MSMPVEDVLFPVGQLMKYNQDKQALSRQNSIPITDLEDLANQLKFIQQ